MADPLDSNSVQPGTMVQGTVTHSYHHGLCVDIGLAVDAYCDNWDVYDKDRDHPDPSRWGPPSHPPVGSKIRAVIIHHDDRRTRISSCPSDLRVSKEGCL